ncbi:LysR family transcriptional regulator [Commensalibacter communis]|nr:LysR family transcriptional regulator [Commensalibacter communis]CAI3950198.1 DNA-binding transcriptional regulator [Commensalibacter communis]CAI3951821.1 DNA-binding transcriptional regulator [Commensalibacter communis]CAI3954508.1 DNA-binding transcriptional regulator [Commensalibacter communis]
MDLNLIKVFLAIYETKSVTHAADQLCITQPSASYALKKLRYELNDVLFVRNNTEMQPTFRAIQYYDIFKKAIQSINLTIADNKAFEYATSSYKFVLAISDIGEFFFLPHIYKYLQSVAPHIRLEILQIDIHQLEDWLLTGKIDAAICNRHDKISHVRCELLLQDQYVCVLNKKHPRIHNKMTFEQFLQEQHIIIASQAGHHYVEKSLLQAGHNINVAIYLPRFITVNELISISESIATIPSKIKYMFDCSKTKILALPFKIPEIEVCMYYNLNNKNIPAKKWFCETIKEICLKTTSQSNK